MTIEDGRVLPGGGAPKIEVALLLREYADGVGGREQLAIEAFADTIEVIPRTLAINAGLDPIDAIVALRAAHDGGDRSAGVPHTEHAGIGDMEAAGVAEPLRVKTQAISSAQEAADLVLRIDDVIAAGDLGGGEDKFDDYDF